MMWQVKLFVCWMTLELSSGEEKIELEIAQGKLNGLKNITVYNSIPFYSFRGIPYAKPNVGYDKFNVAVPMESWSGVYDATKHGNFCLQLNGEKVIGHEDCLFLNVYTPDLNQTAGRAVMVLIHGSAFMSGSGDDREYGPDFLVEKDVVLVTMNYRLGVIGFLNTGDVSAPGNNGLKDQNLALKWIQKNIIYFGGSPDRVTLFGWGAGAASVQYHMLSPMSKGLFNGAILHSGSALNSRTFTYTPADNAKKLADTLRINVSNMTELVEKLKNTRSKIFLLASSRLITNYGIFVPSVENDVGQDVFLPDNPWKLITTGDIADVPVMIGITENEFGHEIQKLSAILAKFKDPLAQSIPDDLNVTDQVQMNSITEKFSKLYFDGLPITLNQSNLIRLFGDAIINHGPLISAELMSARMSSPVYKYLFNYNTISSSLEEKYPEATGVNHGDDKKFIFISPEFNDLPEPGSLDAQKTDEMLEMWTNFAKEGNPSATTNFAKVVWQPMGKNKTYLDIGTKLEMKTNLWQDRVELWANLYKNFIGDYIKLFE